MQFAVINEFALINILPLKGTGVPYLSKVDNFNTGIIFRIKGEV